MPWPSNAERDESNSGGEYEEVDEDDNALSEARGE